MNRRFVIQPFDGGPFDKRYDDVFVPAIRAAGLEAYRVDRDPSVDIPIQWIEDGIRNAVACLADISSPNPNVWFELGYAIASQKPVVLVCSHDPKGRFPFDVQHRAIIVYRTESKRDFEELSVQITARLSAIITNGDRVKRLPVSPNSLHDALTFGLMYGAIGIGAVGSPPNLNDETRALLDVLVKKLCLSQRVVEIIDGVQKRNLKYQGKVVSGMREQLAKELDTSALAAFEIGIWLALLPAIEGDDEQQVEAKLRFEEAGAILDLPIELTTMMSGLLCCKGKTLQENTKQCFEKVGSFLSTSGT